jgi:hypothetical protein
MIFPSLVNESRQASKQTNRKSEMKNSIKHYMVVSFVFPGKSANGTKNPMFLPLYFNTVFPT